MAYTELIKNFNKIRDYMREFYVYGFKSREEYTGKSARSYDDERRRMESWLGDYMHFRQTPEGKHVFLSIDSRLTHHNPLYAAWKTRSFTDGDITLHFLLFDILHEPDVSLNLHEIMEQLDQHVKVFTNARMYDESMVRKKLKEYVTEDIVKAEKRGKVMYYRRANETEIPTADTLNFFSEVAPCGVAGSFLLDKEDAVEDHFNFKHHYITGAMDSEILCELFEAIRQQSYVTLQLTTRRKEVITSEHVVPLKIMISAQGGRQHVMAYVPAFGRITALRIDHIVSVKIGDTCDEFDRYRSDLDQMHSHIWGVSTEGRSGQPMEHVEFTVHYDDDEAFIPQRMEREKRCGIVEKLGPNESRFSADVYDASELIPWIRTFIGRISDIHFSSEDMERQFHEDLEAMYAQYGLKGGDCK